MMEKTMLWAPWLEEERYLNGRVTIQRYAIPCIVVTVNTDEPRPISLFSGGNVSTIKEGDVGIESVHNIRFDMTELDDFRIARREIAKLAGIRISLTDRVISGSIRCYVANMGTTRLWAPEDLVVEYTNTGNHDKAMFGYRQQDIAEDCRENYNRGFGDGYCSAYYGL